VSESQPLAALEAMAAGAPVILANLPYAHQTPFEQVVRCQPDDDQSLEHALEMVLESPGCYRKILPESYSWFNVAQEIIKVYQGVIKT
jgi:glycosyltransferase involved in cell wall biosynthesis